MSDAIERLFQAVTAQRNGDPSASPTANLFAAGRVKIAKKVVEEAAEVSLACMEDDPQEVASEAADLLYNLMVLLVEAGVRPEDVWTEMAKREAELGIAGKWPKGNRS
ncbi:MAG: phosphoribosyl-ATP diphosphatase [Methyloligellaceae bacterium]